MAEPEGQDSTWDGSPALPPSANRVLHGDAGSQPRGDLEGYSLDILDAILED